MDKPSRYRSVRQRQAQAQAQVQAGAPPVPTPRPPPIHNNNTNNNKHHSTQDDHDAIEAAESAKRQESIQRSMSRYRNRPGRVNTTAATAAAVAPPMPAMPRSTEIRHAHTSPAPARVESSFEGVHEDRGETRREKPKKEKIANEKTEKTEKVGFLARFLGSKNKTKTKTKSKDDEKVKTSFSTGDNSGDSRLGSSHSHSAPTPSAKSGRKVRVTCGDQVSEMAVYSETKARDILSLAAETMAAGIDPDTWTLTEFFGPLHLERPLRRYENIRAVVGSWDNDSQNHLVVSRHNEENDLEADEFVEARFAPHKQPIEVSFHIYHASRNGKWEKRYITLRPDGQVTLSKKKKPMTSADSNNICHMSDFDVFTLTRREQKRIRPPKKFSFAVKSMQKSSMFEKNNNFVHYFSVKDIDVAKDFYVAIHGWRSYYLVHVLGVAPGSRNGNHNDNNNGNGNGNSDQGLGGLGVDNATAWGVVPARSRKNTVTSYHPRSSVESHRNNVYPHHHAETQMVDYRNNPHGLGLVDQIPSMPGYYDVHYDEPMLERTRSNVPVSRTNTVHRSIRSSSRPSSPSKFSSSYPLPLPHNVNMAVTTNINTTYSRPPSRDAPVTVNPTSSRPTSRRRNTTATSTATPDEPFAPSGLLGRTYTQKQSALQSRSHPGPNPDASAAEPFQPNSLLAQLSRHQSTHQSQNPNQARNRTRSNTLRRTGTGTASATGSNRPSFENPADGSPFTPGGLLAGLNRVESRGGKGNGMGMMGDFRGGMMTGGGPSQFAEGSLLRDVEARERGY